MEKVMIINNKESKELERIKDYILGTNSDVSDIIYDLEEEHEWTIEEIIEKLKECDENLFKIHQTLCAILNGTYDDIYKLQEYYFGK